jgi:cyclase
MLRSRIIPCLLVRNRGLVKTVRFQGGKYVGDPVNAVRIFNEKEADELIVLDLDASVKGVEPDFKMIRLWASECRMPLCYGGGVKTVAQASRIIGLGVEKVALSSALIERPGLAADIAQEVGSQSVVAVLDVKRVESRPMLFTHNGSRATGICAVNFARQIEDQGVGEIVINSIERDGMMDGYDLELASEIRGAVSIPITVLGGAGAVAHLAELVKRFGIIGAAAGSLFVFKGPYRAVLINYPNPDAKDRMLMRQA